MRWVLYQHPHRHRNHKCANYGAAIGQGYGNFRLGQPLADTTGLKVLFDGGDTKTYQRSTEALVYGLVPAAEGITYTVERGRLTAIDFKVNGYSAGNKLQGCLEQLYGPLARHGLTSYRGSRGAVEALLTRGYDGSASVLLVERAKFAGLE